ncbi:GntR family transcriptional regulator [Corticibacter populi]|uniref:GntR family transcriptional regulator n=1 Tax=Corticibacter populi TaxID=1550736 RepID=A0A3M6QMR1_9BURK|nr:GntR family transcriptional regulator [Corticibacter populi]RMX04245.1 GntR family transcriptional regulator [Corticibacter populi]RZS33287.1 GntR family transcriptional regulator [Corticibacter populi]
MPILSLTPLAADPGHQDADAVSALLRQRLQLSDATVEPYYRQLQRQIQALIDSGALADGDSLPSERELADILQVSRSTVKRGYDGLRETRALVSTQGRGGTLVRSSAPRISPVMSMLKGFTDEMREMGLEPSTRVLECAVVQERTVASIFGKTSSASFLKLVRLRFGDAVPMSREIAWYDLAAAPALADWDGQGSAYAFLRERCGIGLAWAQQSIEAVLSSAAETQAFGFAQPGPCLLLKRSSHDADGRLIEYVEGTFRGDAYVYRLRLQG